MLSLSHSLSLSLSLTRNTCSLSHPPHTHVQVFEQFLGGQTLAECYSVVAGVANRWLDMLDTRGVDLADEELIMYISESSVMSKSLEEYEGGGGEGREMGALL